MSQYNKLYNGSAQDALTALQALGGATVIPATGAYLRLIPSYNRLAGELDVVARKSIRNG
jgi:hypothetical protein